MLSALPADLLLLLTSFAPDPTASYLHFIAVSHSLRAAMRGRPRVLSFAHINGEKLNREIPESGRIPTADALRAIVGPCSDLEELELGLERTMQQCGDGTAWVEATFRDKPHLQTLTIPSLGGLTEVAFERVLTLIGPQLRSLTLASEYWSRQAGVTPDMVSVLAKQCPGLEKLRAFCDSKVTTWKWLLEFPRLSRLTILESSMELPRGAALFEQMPQLQEFNGAERPVALSGLPNPGTHTHSYLSTRNPHPTTFRSWDEPKPDISAYLVTHGATLERIQLDVKHSASQAATGPAGGRSLYQLVIDGLAGCARLKEVRTIRCVTHTHTRVGISDIYARTDLVNQNILAHNHDDPHARP
ncbi:hypothetical protein PAPYR_10105 [Paratrimastix pyriformis]|uniref:F-box domain-containing protein n=1 Tax=Paratrimastix pyriformis TaxID=342808 RepID=A0ABQ8U9D0_9EUKA|nr:hypothetical protein PAPYR_10105 [Paratrimastix pyriformis]